jgi:hypothetical protein
LASFGVDGRICEDKHFAPLPVALQRALQIDNHQLPTTAHAAEVAEGLRKVEVGDGKVRVQWPCWIGSLNEKVVER